MVFSIQIWSYIPCKMLSLEKRLCKMLVVEVTMFLFPSAGHLSNPGMKSRSPIMQANSLPAEPQGKPINTGVGSLSLLQQSSWPRNPTRVSCIAGGFFTNWAIRESLLSLYLHKINPSNLPQMITTVSSFPSTSRKVGLWLRPPPASFLHHTLIFYTIMWNFKYFVWHYLLNIFIIMVS